MKKIFYLVSVFALLISVGCTTVQSTNSFKTMTVGENRKMPVAHVHVRVTGIYLFGFIPLICGSRAGSGKAAFFQDNCTIETVVNLTCKEARGEGGNNIIDLVSHYEDKSYFFWSKRCVSASATSVK